MICIYSFICSHNNYPNFRNEGKLSKSLKVTQLMSYSQETHMSMITKHSAHSLNRTSYFTDQETRV